MSPTPELELGREAGGIALWIHVTPRARRARVGGVHGGALRVAVVEAPVGGAATRACGRALARALGVRPGAVHIDPASKHRRKRARVAGDPAALERRLRVLATGEATD